MSPVHYLLINVSWQSYTEDRFVSLWSIQEKPENNERIRNNGNFISDKKKQMQAENGRETGNLLGVYTE